MHRLPRPAVFIVILLFCACSQSRDANFSDTNQSTVAKGSTAHPQPATSAAAQRAPGPPTTSQPRSGDGQAHAAKKTPTIEYAPWSPCAEKRRAVGDRFKTPWGITLRDIYNTVLGSHRTPLTWRRDEEISYGVEGTSTTLLVEITRVGAATFVARNGAMSGDYDGMMAYDCSSSELLVPLHIKAMTQDGVFSIEGDSELTVSSRRLIVVTLYAAQRGTLQIRGTRDKGTVVDSLGIVLGFRGKRSMVGAIGGGYRCADELTCLHIPYAYACFPERPPFQVDDFIFGACGSTR